MKRSLLTAAVVAPALLFAAPVLAQEEAVGPPAEFDMDNSVFDDTWVSIGVGVGYNPSYTGSDDYVFTPLPIIQGSVGGVDIQPRPAGFALNFLDGNDDGPSFQLGPSVRLRNDRVDQIEDPVVELAGELDRALEVGPAVGIQIPKVLHPFDNITVSADARWDVLGAHDGMVINPSVTYFTPLSQGMIASLSLGTEYVDDSFADYYFSVSPAQSAASGLPLYQADGGFTKLSATTLVGVDFDGNALNGGLGAIVIAGYSRLIGDAADTPYTSQVGSRDQFLLAVGVGYTF